RIIGFCEAVKPQKGKLPAGVTVEKPSAVFGKLRTASLAELNALESKLRESFDFSRIHPIRDEHCFNVVLATLRRGAIQHMVHAEGSYELMNERLSEIVGIITEGKLESKHLYSKPWSYYSEPYRSVLNLVVSNVMKVQAEVNKSREGGVYSLSFESRAKVDRL